MLVFLLHVEEIQMGKKSVSNKARLKWLYNNVTYVSEYFGSMSAWFKAIDTAISTENNPSIVNVINGCNIEEFAVGSIPVGLKAVIVWVEIPVRVEVVASNTFIDLRESIIAKARKKVIAGLSDDFEEHITSIHYDYENTEFTDN